MLMTDQKNQKWLLNINVKTLNFIAAICAFQVCTSQASYPYETSVSLSSNKRSKSSYSRNNN